MHWGFPRFDGKGEVINARSETATQKNMFRRALMEGRCLIPSSWYFEWEKRRSEKIKYALASRDSGLTWLAGISRVDPETGERSFVILTRPVWDGIAFIHVPAVPKQPFCQAFRVLEQHLCRSVQTVLKLPRPARCKGAGRPRRRGLSCFFLSFEAPPLI